MTVVPNKKKCFEKNLNELPSKSEEKILTALSLPHTGVVILRLRSVINISSLMIVFILARSVECAVSK